VEELNNNYNPKIDNRQLAAISKSKEELKDIDEDYLLKTLTCKRK